MGQKRAPLADVSGLCTAVARLGTSKDPILLFPWFSLFFSLFLKASHGHDFWIRSNFPSKVQWLSKLLG